MSIEDLGEQLVKEKEEKARQIQKQKKREEFMLAAAKIGLPLAGRVIEDNILQKATDFFNSENVMNLTREYNKASTNAAGVINTEQQIQQSGKGVFAYFSDLNFEAAKAKAIEVLTLEQKGGRELLNEDEINIMARQIADDQARNQEVEHIDALDIAVNLGTREEFNSELARQLRPTTPQNIVDVMGRKISTFFGGKSTQERQADAINVFKNSYRFDTTQQMQAAVQEFKETNSWRSAFSKAANTAVGSEGQGYWADKIRELRGMKDYEMPVETNASVHTLQDGTRVLDGYTFRRNADGSVNQDSIETLDSVNLSADPRAAKLYDMRFDNQLKTIFDPVTIPEKYLTQAGVDAYEAILNSKTDEDNNKYTRWDFSGTEEHQVLYQTFRDFISDEENAKYIVPQYTQAELYRQRELFVSDWYGDILAEVDESKAREIRHSFPELWQEYEKYRIAAARGEPDAIEPDLPPNFITAMGEITNSRITEPSAAKQKLREAMSAWENKTWADDEIFNGNDDEINAAADYRTDEDEEPNVPPTPVTVPEELAGQRVATPDWPDSYKELQGRLAALEGQTGRAARDSRIRIQHKIDTFVQERTREIGRLSRRTAPGQRPQPQTPISAEHQEQIDKLNEEIEQFIAMQDWIDSTILPAGGAD